MGHVTAPLPTGTITFLFTDIEGSTRRWEQFPRAMEIAVARHDALLRKVVHEHHGAVFKMVGDACCAAFAVPGDALAAAVTAQRALAAEEWGDVGPMRVRMALHTGVAEERDGDYFGQSLNRVARLLSAGHGGQILCSHPTWEMVRDGVPAGIEVVDAGEHRLKDLIRPEHIFQIVLPDLALEFPPLKVLDPARTNLPIQPTPFIGREREVSEVVALLQREGTRLLTLTGPGGTGKTRLALQAGAEVADSYADGVFFVSLAAINRPDLVAPAVAEVVGVREESGRSLEATLRDALQSRQQLLLLDNFEQVVEAAAFVAGLIASCPRLTVLVTSQTVLHLSGEREYPVPALRVPDIRRLPSLEILSQYDAVALFIDRARGIRPDFAVTDENAPAIAEICYRLDGLPLAIELAAARVRLLPPHTLLVRLANRLKLLTGGGRDAPTRQQTLRGAVQWSYGLLEEEEKRLFAFFSVFVGGCTLEAAETICQSAELEVLDGLTSLVDKSLIKQTEPPTGEPRFVMLETIREYAAECLELSGEGDHLRRQHADYFLVLAEEAEPELVGPDQAAWLNRLEEEHDNLRAALDWLARQDVSDQGARLAGALWRFWLTRGYLTEGRRWLEQTSIRARDKRVRAKALGGAGILAARQGEYDPARNLLEQSLGLSREVEDRRLAALCLNGLGNIAVEQREYDRAHLRYEESLTLRRALSDSRGIAIVLGNLGFVAMEMGEYDRARAFYEESLDLSRASGDDEHIANNLNGLGCVALEQGEYARATGLLVESLLLWRDVGHRRGIRASFEDLALAAAQQSQGERAAVLWAAGDSLRMALGQRPSTVDRERYDRIRAAVGMQLDDTGWERAYQRGRVMALEDAIAYALAVDSNPLPADATPAG